MYISAGPDFAIRFSTSNDTTSLSTLFAVLVVFSLPFLFSFTGVTWILEALNVEATSTVCSNASFSVVVVCRFCSTSAFSCFNEVLATLSSWFSPVSRVTSASRLLILSFNSEINVFACANSALLAFLSLRILRISALRASISFCKAVFSPCKLLLAPVIESKRISASSYIILTESRADM